MAFQRMRLSAIPAVLLVGCSGVVDPIGSEAEFDTVEQELAKGPNRGRAVTNWVEHAMQTVRAQNVGTPNAGRLYAMVTAAMYDAVNGIDRARHHGREHALVPPTGAPSNGRQEAAAIAAAHAVLVALVPAQAPVLDQALADDLASLGSSPPVLSGRDWGASVGAAVVALRSADGTQVAENIPAGTAPGAHRAAFDARFRRMTPFAIADKETYVSGAPPALTSPEYTVAFNDVKLLGVQDGDAERNEISSFWLAEGGTPRETGTWLEAAIVIADQERTLRSISDTARLFALIGMATADSVLVSWETKARFFTWRPTPAIREADTDGNPDTVADSTWTSRIGTPGSSPEYNSGTSTFAGAASSVLEIFYRDQSIDFCFETDLASNGPRCYSSALEGAEEAGRSRIYQGIHFEFSNVAARVSGRGIGEEVARESLRPVRHRAGH